MDDQAMLDKIIGNGVRLDTGGYGFQPISLDTFTQAVSGLPIDEAVANELRAWVQATTEGHYGIEAGSDPKKLEESGWGVVFAYNCDPEIRKALKPLLDWRKEQAGAKYYEYAEVSGYRPKDTKRDWLAREPRRHSASSPVDTDIMPYYLMLVGGPETIPYAFQQQLDVQFAVGRVCFDTPEEYASYAKSVVRAEKEKLALPRKVTFFGPQNSNDLSTKASNQHLVTPLADKFADECVQRGKPAWKVSKVTGAAAVKDCLRDHLGGKDSPAILFTASHGLEVPRGDADQSKLMGSLVCQDWQGPGSVRGRLPETHYFSAGDLKDDADVFGRLAFFFACYSAGTPNRDEFIERAERGSGTIADKPFVARLPQRLLSHPAGGALAVIGHVDRAWGYSFFDVRSGDDLQTFIDTFRLLLDGYPIGNAFECFNNRYAAVSTELTDLQHEMEFGYVPAPDLVPKLWTVNNDAKNYVILGDPAVRLMV